MLVSSFNYHLPESSIAHYPLKQRDRSRLMVVDRKKRTVSHRTFSDLTDYLQKDDVMVFNNSRVFPAKLSFQKIDTGVYMEGLVVSVKGENVVEMLIKKSKRLKEGTAIRFENGPVTGTVIKKSSDGKCLVQIFYSGSIFDWLEREGQIPLPHYIKREGRSEHQFDKERYQTIYAKEKGSVAAPTAGLHFTGEILKKVKEKGVGTAELTLHVGYATFKPIRCEKVEDHTMELESFFLSEVVARQINKAKRSGGRIVAIGTTTVRTLESCKTEDGLLVECDGTTDIFITPGYAFRHVDTILTNFHLPQSTLLMLVCAFGGRDFILSAYNEAVRAGYRFYSYGDAMLIV